MIPNIRAIGLAGFVLAILFAAVYVVATAMRGPGTHLGEDTIGFVYLAMFGFIGGSAGIGYWRFKRRCSAQLTFLLLGLSFSMLGAWTWLRNSGRVISYTEYITLTKLRANPQEGLDGINQSGAETNKTSAPAGLHPGVD